MDNRDDTDTKEGNCDRLWEIQYIFEILNRAFSRFHNPSYNLATDEVIVLFRRKIYSENIFPRSMNVFVSNYANYTTHLETQKYVWERTGRTRQHS
jgi:hypothetical protein